MYGGDIAAIGGAVLWFATLWLWFTSTEGR
jgi:hypothetical protein